MKPGVLNVRSMSAYANRNLTVCTRASLSQGRVLRPSLAATAKLRRFPLPNHAGLFLPATPAPENHAEVDRNFFFYQVSPLHAALWQSRSEPVKALRWRCDERA